MGNNKIIGNAGEDMAFEHLCSIGYKILDRNFRCKLGEIDLIGFDGDIICFIEVKTRTSNIYGSPSEAVSSYKQNRIVKSALMYISRNRLNNFMCRFDVIEIIAVGRLENSQINLIKDAFQYSGKYGY